MKFLKKNPTRLFRCLPGNVQTMRNVVITIMRNQKDQNILHSSSTTHQRSVSPGSKLWVSGRNRTGIATPKPRQLCRCVHSFESRQLHSGKKRQAEPEHELEWSMRCLFFWKAEIFCSASCFFRHGFGVNTEMKFTKKIHKRLKLIKKNWSKLTRSNWTKRISKVPELAAIIMSPQPQLFWRVPRPVQLPLRTVRNEGTADC